MSRVLSHRLLILVTWAALLAIIGGYQLLGLGTGFSVWPLGEDRNWVDILQRGRGANAASLFWTINDRNPLSPWWYIAFRALILQVDSGLLILRYLVGLALALATYDLIRLLCGKTFRTFALACAMVIVVSMANGYFDQIYWNFQAALVCSIICLICYLRFVASHRFSIGWYAASLVFWLIAVASYTIQSGSILAIAYLAFIRPGSTTPTFVQRLKASFKDSWPFAIVFGAFLLIWRTTTRASEQYAMRPSFTGFMASVRQGIAHYDLDLLMSSLRAAPYFWFYVAAGVLLGLAVWGTLTYAMRQQSEVASPTVNLLHLMLIVVCIAAPTIAVESSAAAWSPGTRWRMIYQFTTPMFYLTGIAIVVSVLRLPLNRVTPVCAACLVAAAVSLTLAQNRMQVDITRAERALRDTIFGIAVDAFASGSQPPLQVIVRQRPGFGWYSSDSLSAVYAQTWFRRDDISFRMIPVETLSGPYAPYWPVVFAEDSVGVKNAKLWAITSPYANTRFLDAGHDQIVERDSIGPADLEGFRAVWDRTGQAVSFPTTTKACPFKWTADKPFIGRGISVRESNGDVPFRWMVARRALIYLPQTCGASAEVAITVAAAGSEKNRNGLALQIDGRVVSLDRQTLPDGHIRYRGSLPAGAPGSPPKPVELQLVVPSLDEIPDDDRKFGVELEAIEIMPARKGGVQ